MAVMLGGQPAVLFWKRLAPPSLPNFGPATPLLFAVVKGQALGSSKRTPSPFQKSKGSQGSHSNFLSSERRWSKAELGQSISC